MRLSTTYVQVVRGVQAVATTTTTTGSWQYCTLHNINQQCQHQHWTHCPLCAAAPFPLLSSCRLWLCSSKSNPVTCSGAASAGFFLVRVHLLVAYCSQHIHGLDERARGAKSGCKKRQWPLNRELYNPPFYIRRT
jgi:hypothetical protein